MSDLISRQKAMDEMSKQKTYKMFAGEDTVYLDANDVGSVLASLPSAQPEYHFDEWCTECKEYDQERHCCPRFNAVIRTALEETKANIREGEEE